MCVCVCDGGKRRDRYLPRGLERGGGVAELLRVLLRDGLLQKPVPQCCCGLHHNLESCRVGSWIKGGAGAVWMWMWWLLGGC